MKLLVVLFIFSGLVFWINTVVASIPTMAYLSFRSADSKPLYPRIRNWSLAGLLVSGFLIIWLLLKVL